MNISRTEANFSGKWRIHKTAFRRWFLPELAIRHRQVLADIPAAFTHFMKAILSTTIVALLSTALAGCWIYSRPDPQTDGMDPARLYTGSQWAQDVLSNIRTKRGATVIKVNSSKIVWAGCWSYPG